MSNKTRYFVIASLLVLGVGVSTGLVAYYVGFPTSAFTSRGGPDELQYVPRDAAVVAFADVSEVMNSELRRRLRAALPISENGKQEFQDKTGINIESDIDRVVACIGGSTGLNAPQTGMVIATGRFDTVKIESMMREHGAAVEEYKTTRLLLSTEAMHKALDAEAGLNGATSEPDVQKPDHVFALAFLKPGIIAVGSTELIHRAIDLGNGGDNITTNDEVMDLVRSLDAGNNAWALGHLDALGPKTKLPETVASQMSSINLFSVSAHIDGGLQGTLRAEARDDEAAKNLRDVVNGLLALGKLQSGSRPEVAAMMQSLQLSGTGKTVALSFSVPAGLFEMMQQKLPQHLGQHENR